MMREHPEDSWWKWLAMTPAELAAAVRMLRKGG